MSKVRQDAVRELLVQSLIAWRVTGSVIRTSGGAIRVWGDGGNICIEPAPPHVPFRWMVTVDSRKRGAISLVAVLRQVRAALDPGYARTRVRMAVSPLVPG